jgi:UDP:flavonoid glycosyltransferase YjiC (YdhE family)
VSQPKRILFLSEGATMAHLARPLMLADSLDPSVYEIHFRAAERFSGYLQGKPYSTGTIWSMPSEQFLDNIARGKPLFPAEVLRRYVREERDLLRAIRPDLVIGDLRLSLPISARLENAPWAMITNAYWSPWAKKRSIIPEIPLTRVFPPRWLNPIYGLVEPLAFSLHVAHMNRVRKEFGVPPLPRDLRQMYMDATHVLYADVPEFIPVVGAPAHHHYVGPCDWTPPGPLPDWWDEMLGDPKPKVVVALGSSGPWRVLPHLLAALARLPVSVVLAASGHEVAPFGAVKYKAPLLPLRAAAAASRVVVSHGGSTGVYPAVAEGTPVLALPSNADQQLSAAVLEENGAGISVRVEEASERRLKSALERLMFEEPLGKAARHWKGVMGKHETRRMFRAFVETALR